MFAMSQQAVSAVSIQNSTYCSVEEKKIVSHKVAHIRTVILCETIFGKGKSAVDQAV